MQSWPVEITADANRLLHLGSVELLLDLNKVFKLKDDDMGLLPIVPKEGGTSNHRCYLTYEQLPAFYMEDFSVMGLSVEQLETAVAVLQRNGIEINRDGAMAMARIDGLTGMKTVLGLLEENGIAFELTDIADQIYQG